ncbi:ATP-binding protein [Desulfonatronum thioautotrophicum]|uniref:ATP-binding protein n=1 Tax=Desulfonatronum thioautotrophicum TaxID=617001 RepID=UPI000699882A|nr:ATP-binding protein [Desulfonatronum thioautotrophicum]
MNRSRRILVVDDSPLQLCMYTEILASVGYEVTQASGGIQALQLIDAIRPQLVLLDVVLPDINGIDVCKRIKSDRVLNATSIILFSAAQVDSDSQAIGIECGADDYLIKPIDARELLARVAALFRLRQMEHDIRQSHMELHQVLSSIMSILIVIDRNGLVQRWNSVAAKTLGVSFDQAYHQSFEGLALPWDHTRVAQAVRESRESMTGIVMEDLRFQRQNAQDGYLKLSIAPLLTTSAETMGGLILLGEDVTERRLLEGQLIQAQKLESIGQLAAGVAHEINTPIQFLSDNMRFLQEGFEELNGLVSTSRELVRNASNNHFSTQEVGKLADRYAAADLDYLLQEIPQAIAQSLEGLERVTHIVRSMKSFAHPGEQCMVLADINAALTDTVTVSRNEWKYVAEMHMDLDPDLPLVMCLVSELNQAFLNIITNAAQAVAEAYGEHSLEQGVITISSRKDGEWIEIRITDNGTGIPENIRPRLFDPFFTTKEVGKGTGQGLVIVHNAIVTRHGGSIAVESTVGQGTTFVLRLPVNGATEETFVENLD